MSEGADPFLLSFHDLSTLSESIRSDLIVSDHPVLRRAAGHFFEGDADGRKKVRPMMVLLVARVMAEAEANADASEDRTETTRTTTAATRTLATSPQPWQRPDLPSAQRCLAEISELIHTASLFHDDVIDGALTRRGAPAVHVTFGNNVATMAGDYLLARASIFLDRVEGCHET